jgi:ribonuclease HI
MTECVFCDGAYSPKQNKGSIGVFFENHSDWSFSEDLIDAHKTNQRAELYAIIRSIEVLNEKYDGDVLIKTDSMYSIKCITEWYKTWIKNNWRNSQKKPVKNRDLIEKILALIQNSSRKIEFQHVKGHTTEPENKNGIQWMNWYGNKRSDELAAQNQIKEKNII